MADTPKTYFTVTDVRIASDGEERSVVEGDHFFEWKRDASEKGEAPSITCSRLVMSNLSFSMTFTLTPEQAWDWTVGMFLTPDQLRFTCAPGWNERIQNMNIGVIRVTDSAGFTYAYRWHRDNKGAMHFDGLIDPRTVLLKPPDRKEQYQ